ncbi:MAG: lipocalin family protein [Oligoflexia bacterium]|nr:lipocalin family protein [Oligoflexia bacterium]MBF0367514.1 lipocalin family protein [Oligoflexia bacterium]
MNLKYLWHSILSVSFFLLIFSFNIGSSAMAFDTTVNHVDLQKYMGKWYVIAGRLTFLENGAHNATETYTWNEKEKRIDIDFQMNKNSFDGALKRYPQKGWVVNDKSNATWEISFFWPLKFTYLIIALDPNYEWTVVGVPSERYFWIMSRTPKMSKEQLNNIISHVNKLGYDTTEMIFVPHK